MTKGFNIYDPWATFVADLVGSLFYGVFSLYWTASWTMGWVSSLSISLAEYGTVPIWLFLPVIGVFAGGLTCSIGLALFLVFLSWPTTIYRIAVIGTDTFQMISSFKTVRMSALSIISIAREEPKLIAREEPKLTIRYRDPEARTVSIYLAGEAEAFLAYLLDVNPYTLLTGVTQIENQLFDQIVTEC